MTDGVTEKMETAENAVIGEDPKEAQGSQINSAEAQQEEGVQEEASDSSADEAQTGAPEEYADFSLPEDMPMDAEAMDAFKPLAKELGLSQEQAQKLVDIQAQAVARFTEAQTQAFVETTNGWLESAKGDDEIGGPNFDARVATAKKAVEFFGTPELIEAFDMTGVGNHPEFLRAFYRIGKLMEDDPVRFGSSQQAGPKDPAKILFPNMN